jgi:hypothetical protein
MKTGQRVRLTTHIAPSGLVMESLADICEARIPGSVMAPSQPEGWLLIAFDNMPNGDRLNVHASMLTPYRTP